MTKKYEKYISKKKKKGKSKTQKHNKQKHNKQKHKNEKHNKKGGNPTTPFLNYLNTILQNKDKNTSAIESTRQLIDWHNSLNENSINILNKYFIFNDFALENDCHQIGKGVFGSVYLNSSLNQTTSNKNFTPTTPTTQNFYSISNRVIKVIQSYDDSISFFNFFLETMDEFFKVKNIFNLFSNKGLYIRIVDIEKYFFDMETKTIYFVMKQFQYTLFNFISLFPSNPSLKNFKGGKLKYDNDELISVLNNVTQTCSNSIRHPPQKYLQMLTSLKQKINIIKQIVYGVFLIHSSNIVHRDLKPGNILINILKDDNLEVCITDFGLAVYNNENTLKAGTPLYLPPETFNDSLFYFRQTFSLDIFSLGIICFIIFSYSFEWEHYLASIEQNLNRLHEKTFYNSIYYNVIEQKMDENYIPTEIKEFILKCVSFEPEDRPTAQECLKMVSTWSDNEPQDQFF